MIKSYIDLKYLKLKNGVSKVKIFKSRSLIGDGKIGIHRAKAALPINEHTHDYIEIVYVASGTAIECVDGIKYNVRRGDFIFMTPNSIHSFIPDAEFEHIEIFFSPNLIGESVMTSSEALSMLALGSFDNLRNNKSFGLIRVGESEIDLVESILKMMESEFASKSEGYEAFMCNCLNMLLIKMLRIASRATDSEDMWNALLEYIEHNYNKKLTLAALSSKCFYNPTYFSRAFKQKYGVSLTSYLKQKRIDNAKKLLLNDSLTVEAVAESVGFSDRSAFYAAFESDVNMTPMQYRKKFKSKN